MSDYKQMYENTAKELYTTKICNHSMWQGDSNIYSLMNDYNLSELKDLWDDLVLAEYEYNAIIDTNLEQKIYK